MRPHPRYSSWDALAFSEMPEEARRDLRRLVRTPDPRRRALRAAISAIATVAVAGAAIALLLFGRVGDTGDVGALKPYLVTGGLGFTVGWPLWIACWSRDVHRSCMVLRRRRTALPRSVHRFGRADWAPEFIHRRTWDARLSRARLRRTRRYAENRPGLIAALPVLVVVPVTLLLVREELAPALSIFMAPLMLSPCALVIAYLAIGRGPVRRIRRALTHATCPDCAYPLAEVPPAFAPDPATGASPGPRRCPECGSPWPLIPPEVPA